MCDAGYLCANVGLPIGLSVLDRPDVRDRQTDVRRQTASSLNTPAY